MHVGTKRRSCAAHLLSLIVSKDVKNFLKAITQSSASDKRTFKNRYNRCFSTISSISKHHSKSTKFSESVKDFFGKYLVIPNDTRWLSEYLSSRDLIKKIGDDLERFNKFITDYNEENKPKFPVKTITQEQHEFLKEYIKVS